VGDGIRVAWPSITRAWRPGAGVWLLLSGRGAGEAYEALAGAMSRANERRAAAADAPEVGGAGVGLTGTGPVLFVGFADSLAALRGYVEDVAADLGAHGVSGRLGAARSEETAFDRELSTCLAAAATVPLDVDAVTRSAAVSPALVRWFGRPEATAALVERAVHWAGRAGQGSDGTVYVRTEGFQRRCTPDQGRDQLLFHLDRGMQEASVLGLGQEPGARLVTFSPVGHVGVVARSSTGDRLDDFDALKQFLVGAASYLEQGLVRQAGSVPGAWSNIVCGLPPRPRYGDREANTYWLGLGRHLFDRYVVDAYAGQLLTDAHRDGVPDWSGWTVERVAEGRSWVQPPDVRAWVEGETAPEPAVLAARAVCRPIMLRPEVVERAPRPW
jgi:hypothetical protein